MRLNMTRDQRVNLDIHYGPGNDGRRFLWRYCQLDVD